MLSHETVDCCASECTLNVVLYGLQTRNILLLCGVVSPPSTDTKTSPSSTHKVPQLPAVPMQPDVPEENTPPESNAAPTEHEQGGAAEPTGWNEVDFDADPDQPPVHADAESWTSDGQPPQTDESVHNAVSAAESDPTDPADAAMVSIGGGSEGDDVDDDDDGGGGGGDEVSGDNDAFVSRWGPTHDTASDMGGPVSFEDGAPQSVDVSAEGAFSLFESGPMASSSLTAVGGPSEEEPPLAAALFGAPVPSFFDSIGGGDSAAGDSIAASLFSSAGSSPPSASALFGSSPPAATAADGHSDRVTIAQGDTAQSRQQERRAPVTTHSSAAGPVAPDPVMAVEITKLLQQELQQERAQLQKQQEMQQQLMMQQFETMMTRMVTIASQSASQSASPSVTVLAARPSSEKAASDSASDDGSVRAVVVEDPEIAARRAAELSAAEAAAKRRRELELRLAQLRREEEEAEMLRLEEAVRSKEDALRKGKRAPDTARVDTGGERVGDDAPPLSPTTEYTQYLTDDGVAYYHNATTGETVWEPPSCWLATQEASTAAAKPYVCDLP